MAPSRNVRKAKNITGDIGNITRNWHIQPFSRCLPKALWPNNRQSDEWGDDFIALLSQISSIPAATVPDFRMRLRRAIQLRQEKNNSAIGRQPWAKDVDLKAVLKEYEKEAEETKAQETRPAVKTNGRGNRTTRATRTRVPQTPVNHKDEDEDEEQEEGSSEPLAGGKYQYLNGVRPVKVNLNPTASAARKPMRSKPPPRGKRRKAHEDKMPNGQVAELPNVVHQDPDPRVPEDTGFLSDLEDGGDGGVEGKGEKRKKRLSRLQQQRVREPHWQEDLNNIAIDVPGSGGFLETPTLRSEVDAAPALSHEDMEDMEDVAMNDGEDVTMQNLEDVHMSNAENTTLHNGHDVIMNDGEDVEMELENLPEIPENATVTERREMEELRLRIEQRVWRIKVLRIKERECAGGEVVEGEHDNVARKGRVFRKRRGK